MRAGFGAYGKIPAAGDFLRLNVSVPFLRAWDPWMQELLVSGRRVYGETEFDSLYMTAPIWRFTLSAGLVGPQKMLGVLMPSVDRVGRRFPLTIVGALDTSTAAVMHHLQEAELFAALEDLALSALDDEMTAEVFSERLAGLPRALLQGNAAYNMGRLPLVLRDCGTFAEVQEALVSGLSDAHFSGASYWTTILEEGPRVLICDGLPDAKECIGLFDLSASVWTQGRSP